MIWKSPTGHEFTEPTLAAVDAILRSPRVRAMWCSHKGDFAMYARLTPNEYGTLPAVRRLVDQVLNDAGFTCINHPPAA